MKSFFVASLLLFVSPFWSQSLSSDNPLISKEKQAFEQTQRFVANPNTQNYDVKYHIISPEK